MEDVTTLPLWPADEPAAELAPGIVLLRRFADPAQLAGPLAAVLAAAPPRHFVTPGGRPMSAAMTNCGALGWTSGPDGYAYSPVDPASGRPWPALPPAFAALAHRAAAQAGFAGFAPDACLVNRYAAGAGMTAHQDRDERDLTQPIVSVSLGLPATFFWHDGHGRRAPARSARLTDGDVLVFGGPARLVYHGVRPLRVPAGAEAATFRYNLTLRRAG